MPAGGGLEQPSGARAGQVVNRREVARPWELLPLLLGDVVLEQGAGGSHRGGPRAPESCWELEGPSHGYRPLETQSLGELMRLACVTVSAHTPPDTPLFTCTGIHSPAHTPVHTSVHTHAHTRTCSPPTPEPCVGPQCTVEQKIRFKSQLHHVLARDYGISRDPSGPRFLHLPGGARTPALPLGCLKI